MSMMMMSKTTASDNIMGSSFNEFKRQASFFLRDKIKSARLKLTDVTPAQLLTEEVTNGNPLPPDARTMGLISQAAFEVDDFWRIVDILHKRFLQFNVLNWRVSYNALMLLEHLLTHGPQSTVGEFQDEKEVIEEMKHFRFVDENGFDWGSRVQILSERVVKLLESKQFWQEERTKARKLTRGIQGFSYCQRSCSLDADLQNSSVQKIYRKWNSYGNAYNNEEDELLLSSLKEVCRRSNSCSVPERMHPNAEFAGTEYHHHPFLDSGNRSTESLLSKKLV